MLSASQIVDAISRRALQQVHVKVYWVTTASDRDQLAAEVREYANGRAIFPIVVRAAGFQNVNAVMADLVALLEEDRCDLMEQFEACTESLDGCALVLISRSELGLAQISSPALFPGWFPVVGGLEAHVEIEDLNWSADAFLDAPESRIDEIAEALFSLEGALLGRMLEVNNGDHRVGASFFEYIRRGEPAAEKYGLFLEDARVWRRTIHSSASFRPSIREGRSLLARLWEVAIAQSNDRVASFSKALAKALALHAVSTPLGAPLFMSLILRPRTPGFGAVEEYARSMIVGIGFGCQLVTVAAHADAYPSYPLVLVRATSEELLRFLTNAEETIRTLS